jgi:hypothetical protein
MDDLKPVSGTKVRNKKDNRIGVVVPDLFGLCSNGSVMVEYDRTHNLEATPCQDLEAVGKVNVASDGGNCSVCFFCRGKACLRYTEPGLRMLYVNAGTKGKSIPVRIYPDCRSSS